MKTLFSCLLTFLLLQALAVTGQRKSLPYSELYTLDGTKTDTRAIVNEGMPLVLVLWKTYDRKCSENLFDVCNIWDEKLKEKGIKLVAICTDCTGSSDHIKPYVLGHGIDAQVYVDKNGEFKRKMCVTDGPYTILFDKDMKVYCEYSGYCSGIDEALCEKVKKCLDGIAETRVD